MSLRQILLGLLTGCTLALPAAAQQSDSDTIEDLPRELGEALGRLIEELGPQLEALKRELRELDRYEPPELLPNGDIIIRRKRPENEAPKTRPGEAEPPGLDL
jgi:hypothetical protein